MTPAELHQTILRTLTQVRDIRNEHWTDDDAPACDEMLGEMARNTAQALIGLVDFEIKEGAECPLCGTEFGTE